MNWAEIGVRRLAIIQRIAANEKLPNVNHWIETGEIRVQSRKPPEDSPEVFVARKQIEKDGRVIVENVTKAVEQWREHQG